VTRTFALALPVMFGRAGLLIAITVALAVVGHAGPNDSKRPNTSELRGDGCKTTESLFNAGDNRLLQQNLP